MAKPNKIASKLVRYAGLLVIVSFCTYALMFSMMDLNIAKLDISREFALGFSGLENKFFDHRYSEYLRAHNKGEQDKSIVLAEIDDDSLAAIGRWPWTRTKWAKFIDIMKEAEAKVLTFDVIMSEPELACNAESPDISLANSIKNFQSIPGNHVIIGYTTIDESFGGYYEEVPDILYNMLIDTKNQVGANFEKYKIDSTTFPIKSLVEANPSLGYISANTDLDGVFRHYPAVNNVDDTFYLPAAGLAAYMNYSGDKVKAEVNQTGTGTLLLKTGKMKLDSNGSSKIRYLGGKDYFPRVSLKNILDPNADKESLKAVFKDKIVYVGSSATAAHDLRHTPIDPQLPGVYVHMNFTAGAIKGHFFQPEEESFKYSIIILILGSILIILMQQIIGNAVLDIFFLAGLLAGAFYIDWYYFLPRGYEIKLFFTFFGYIGIYSWNTLLNFAAANKEKKQIKGTFSRYVAPAIVNQMLTDPDKLVLGGEKKNITCIFSDVRDFTSISEKLTPAELSQCLNIYMSKMTNILFETYGTLDKYIGDAIVGYWGAPLELENHAYHGVRGAIQMVEALPAINDLFRSQGFPNFKIGIGLNSGECSVGNMGSDKIFSYTALGDNMNLGSRLESLCKYYGVQINISEFTLNAIPDDKKAEFKFRSLDYVKVKGKENPVRIFEVLHCHHPYFKDEVALKEYEHAYALYLKQNFLEAIQILDELLTRYPEDKPATLLKENCEEFLSNPPGPDWDGVTTHKEK